MLAVNVTPLTHHDIVRVAAPLAKRGLRIDLAATDRAARRIAFHPRVWSGDETLHALHTLTVLPDGDVELVRAVARDAAGPASTLIARAAAVDAVIGAFDEIAPTRQIVDDGDVVAAVDLTLEPLDEQGSTGARAVIQQIVGQVGPLSLMVDVSTGSGMPADVLLVERATWTDHVRETLASGALAPARHFAARHLLEILGREGTRADPLFATVPPSPLAALPDDVLAVLGPEWRPLVWQGDRWKGVLRLLGHEPGRGARAEQRSLRALAHLAAVIGSSPARYHAQHAAARRRVWARRLRPALALLAILAVMPLSWLLVARGGAEMHPLALGLTPLLMVGVVLMSSREIPVLEIPALPRPLDEGRWSAVSFDR